MHAQSATGLSPDCNSAARALAWLSAVYFVFQVVAYILTADWSRPIPRDGSTLVVGRDFLNFWMYGRAAFTLDPSRFYDPQLYNSAVAALVGSGHPGVNWSYPPSVMLLAAPFAALTYLQALMLWTVLSAAVFLWFASRVLTDRRLLLALIFSPAALFCLMSGQNTFITTAMLVGIFMWLGRRPATAGLLIGALSIKPQLGLLLPVLLIASARWLVFAVAAATVVAIVALTALIFGPQVWIDYITKGIPVQSSILADPRIISAPFMPTVFMNLRSIGTSYDLAMGIQFFFSALAVIGTFWAFHFRRNADPMILMAFFFACMVFGSPYLLIYDTLPLTFAVLLLLGSGKLDAVGIRLALLTYWLAAFQLALGTLGLPGPALIAPAMAIYLLYRLKGREGWIPRRSHAAAANR